ncbi:uncharacterized protein RAG0_12101 [Rhynchosporium agropyri]|uniref:WSC domain-containing protein n=2 Tax=Rhynchosporium TaxID=38037 RepID=A0A1E1LUG1_RHYSE|nr:uncharacterized protein RAG0_12101 [Rhynchosporium agropyri]CZT40122.1 uncharacterized protein RSE6_00111 [Rhynchosporium secalis]
MKSSTAFSLLAFASSVVSSPLAAPELEGRNFYPACAPQDQVLIYAGLNRDFCSAYLQQTSTAQVVKTALSTVYAASTTTQTVFTTSTATPAAPTAPTAPPASTTPPASTAPAVVCGVAGFAQASAVTTFFNNDGSFTSAQCQTKCQSLAAGTFASGGTLCACYTGSVNNVVAPAPASQYIFSDVNCPGASAPVAVTAPAKRAAGTCAPASAKQVPYIIQKLNPGPAKISSACSCLLNKETPAACVVTAYATVTSTTTVVQVQTTTTTNVVVATAA